MLETAPKLERELDELLNDYVDCAVSTFSPAISEIDRHRVFEGHRNLILRDTGEVDETDSSWEYCLWRSENGRNISKQHEHRKNWADLQAEAASVDTPTVPPALRDDPVILLLFIIYFRTGRYQK